MFHCDRIYIQGGQLHAHAPSLYTNKRIITRKVGYAETVITGYGGNKAVWRSQPRLVNVWQAHESEYFLINT